MEESKVRRILSDEWRTVLSIASPLVAVGVAWFSMQTKIELIAQKVATIEGNHLVHIQASMEKIADNVERLSQSEIETRTLLLQHLKQ